jgi:hypothetical protein
MYKENAANAMPRISWQLLGYSQTRCIVISSDLFASSALGNAGRRWRDKMFFLIEAVLWQWIFVIQQFYAEYRTASPSIPGGPVVGICKGGYSALSGRNIRTFSASRRAWPPKILKFSSMMKGLFKPSCGMLSARCLICFLERLRSLRLFGSRLRTGTKVTCGRLDILDSAWLKRSLIIVHVDDDCSNAAATDFVVTLWQL